MNDIITLDYGSGGSRTSRLIEEMLLPAFQNEQLSQLGDGAVLDLTGPLVFSTDSFVVDPIFFPGGNIGKLAVVTETIDELQGKGSVKISGVLWSARSADGTVIEEGSVVRVTELEGAKVCVKKELKEATL